MALVHNPQLEGFEYTPITQVGEDNPFKLTLKTLSPRELVSLQDTLVARDDKGHTVIKAGAYSVAVCLAGIVGWSGLQDTVKNEVPMSKTVLGTISEDSLNKIPHTFYEEIASVIVAVSQDPTSVDEITKHA